MSVWTLQYGATTQELGEWGMSKVRRQRLSRGRDVVTMEQAGTAYDSEEIFAFNSIIHIYRDGVQWFEGRALRARRLGKSSYEGMLWTIAGPWYDLEQSMFAQSWLHFPDSGSTTINTGRVFLNLIHNEIRDQITAILQYAIDNVSVNLQIGNILPEADESTGIVVDELRDITCAEAIMRELRWIWDAVTWFDYSTSPPTFHCRRASYLSAIAVPVGVTDSKAEELEIFARDDLIRPSVVIHYETVNTVDGVPMSYITEDKFPLAATGTEFGALSLTFELGGAVQNTTSGFINSAVLQHEHATASVRNAWWIARFPYLGSSEVTNLSITAVSRTGVLGLENEIIGGQRADWMTFDGFEVQSESETISCKVTYSKLFPGSATILDEIKEAKVSYKLTTTDSPTGIQEYGNVETTAAGDPQPAAIAEFLYNILSQTQWQGTLPFIEQDCSGIVEMGDKITITGGLTAWETMLAIVVQTEEDVDAGRTTIQFGPPEFVVADLIELLRITRPRNRVTPTTRQSEGTFADNNIELGSQMADSNTTAGEGQFEKFTVGNKSDTHVAITSDQTEAKAVFTTGTKVITVHSLENRIKIDDGAGKSVEMDLDELVSGNTVVKLRLTEICESGTAKSCWVLRSEGV